MADFTRSDRVGAEIRRELSQMLRDAVNDERLSQITVQEVRVTRDLSYAKVYYTRLEAGPDKNLQKALTGAAGFLRKLLAASMNIRTVPQLQFVYDKSIEEGLRLSALIEKAVAKDHQEK